MANCLNSWICVSDACARTEPISAAPAKREGCLAVDAANVRLPILIDLVGVEQLLQLTVAKFAEGRSKNAYHPYIACSGREHGGLGKEEIADQYGATHGHHGVERRFPSPQRSAVDRIVMDQRGDMKEFDAGGRGDQFFESVLIAITFARQKHEQRAQSFATCEHDLPDDRRCQRIRELRDLDHSLGDPVEIRRHRVLESSDNLNAVSCIRACRHSCSRLPVGQPCSRIQYPGPCAPVSKLW